MLVHNIKLQQFGYEVHLTGFFFKTLQNTFLTEFIVKHV